MSVDSFKHAEGQSEFVIWKLTGCGFSPCRDTLTLRWNTDIHASSGDHWSFEGGQTELHDCFDTSVPIRDEADEIHESKSLQEEELKQCFERQIATWEATARKNRCCSKEGLQLSQSNNTKGQNLEQEWDSLFSSTTENGWAKRQRRHGQTLEG